VNVRRPIALAAAAGLAVLALAGCANQAGAASQVGPTTITDRQVADVVAEVKAQNAKVAGSTFDEKTTTSNVVAFLTQKQILEQAAAREGVTVSQGDVDRVIADGEANLGGDRQKVADYIFTNVGLPSEQLDAYLRTTLLYSGLVAKIAPGVTDSTAQSKAAKDYLEKFSSEIGVQVSPRFGTWTGISVGPVPNDLSFDPNAKASASATPTPSAS
jgi:hypothetical protein